MGAVRARSLLVAIAMAAGDVEQRITGEVFANLREQTATIIFFDSLIVQNHQSHIWLCKHLVTHISVGAPANQLPRTLDDTQYKVRQRLVVRQEQQSGREAHFLQSLRFHL